MANSDPARGLFQFVLFILGIIYFFLNQTREDWIGTSLLATALIFLGILYIIYVGLALENSVSQVLYLVGSLLAFIVIFGFKWLFLIGECSLTNPCGVGQFCGSDHICHTPPALTHTITLRTIVTSVDLTFAGVLLGGSLIVAAWLLKDTPFYDSMEKKWYLGWEKIKRVFRRK